MDEQKKGGISETETLATGEWIPRSAVERRSGLDQRSRNGGKRPPRKRVECRRSDMERRRTEERREGWMRVDHWRSVPVFD